VLHNTRLEILAKDKHSSLLEPFVSYKENENMDPGVILTTLHFLYNLQIGPKARVLHYTKLEILARDKHSSLLEPFISYAKNEVL
jgi:hypothetical protein